MMFKLTAMTPQAQWRVFCLHHKDLEVVYDLLYTLVQKGDTLVNVTLIDENGYLPLPLDALEEALFRNPIGGLRQQWESLLAQPVRGYLSKDELQQRFISLRQKRIGSIRRTLNHTQGILERTQQLKEGSGKAMMLEYYQHLLDRYSRLLVRLETDSAWRLIYYA